VPGVVGGCLLSTRCEQNITEINKMNDDLKEFWHTTWTVWKSGVLSAISNCYVEEASVRFDDFIKTSEDVRNPLVEKFFVTYPPRKNEFLIAFTQSKERPTLVLTSQRLWMYGKETQEYVNVDLADIVEFKSDSEWSSHKVKIHFKDKTECDYRKLADVPTSLEIKIAIQLCNNQEGKPISVSGVIEPVTVNQIIGRWSIAFGKVGGPISFIICIMMVIEYNPSPGHSLPFIWNIGIGAGTFVVIAVVYGLGALFGYLVWLFRYRRKQPHVPNHRNGDVKH
jgi:hypothetical protein